MFQRRALGGSAKHRCGRVVRELASRHGVDPRIGFPDGDVDDHVGVEPGDDLDDSSAVVGFDPVEDGLAQPTSRRVDIDALERADPLL